MYGGADSLGPQLSKYCRVHLESWFVRKQDKVNYVLLGEAFGSKGDRKENSKQLLTWMLVSKRLEHFPV